MAVSGAERFCEAGDLTNGDMKFLFERLRTTATTGALALICQQCTLLHSSCVR